MITHVINHSQWILVVEQVKIFKNPLYKGFRNLHEALAFARSSIGIKFFVDPLCKNELQRVRSHYDKTPSCSYSSVVECDNINILEFCRHCDSMVRNYKLLNDKRRSYNEEINSQKEKVKSLSQ